MTDSGKTRKKIKITILNKIIKNDDGCGNKVETRSAYNTINLVKIIATIYPDILQLIEILEM